MNWAAVIPINNVTFYSKKHEWLSMLLLEQSCLPGKGTLSGCLRLCGQNVSESLNCIRHIDKSCVDVFTSGGIRDPQIT